MMRQWDLSILISIAPVFEHGRDGLHSCCVDPVEVRNLRSQFTVLSNWHEALLDAPAWQIHQRPVKRRWVFLMLCFALLSPQQHSHFPLMSMLLQGDWMVVCVMKSERNSFSFSFSILSMLHSLTCIKEFVNRLIESKEWKINTKEALNLMECGDPDLYFIATRWGWLLHMSLDHFTLAWWKIVLFLSVKCFRSYFILAWSVFYC